MKTTFSTVLIRLLSLFFFAILLCFPQEALSGASNGLLLWFQTVLPTLLPCMVVADFLLRIGADRYLTRLIARPFSILFGLSTDGCYAALVGLLCGYPMGAKTTASLLVQTRIPHWEASYLLAFTNQPSPMFLIGYLCLGLFADRTVSTPIFSLLVGVYGSAILVSLIYRLTRRMNQTLLHSWTAGNSLAVRSHIRSGAISDVRQHTLSGARIDTQPNTPSSLMHNKSADSSPLSLLESSMMTSFEVMVKIGGYMMLFSIGEAFIGKLPGLPPTLKWILMGLVEMTTGSRHIAVGIALPWSFALCGAVTAFGGLSGFAQTANVLKDSGLSSGRYFLWKILQGILAGILILLWFFLTEAYHIGS